MTNRDLEGHIFLSYPHTINGYFSYSKIENEYEQVMPQSQIADKPMAQRGRAT